ncbi:MAG: hypothetical protein LBB81_09070 [Treponema sp.]|nr:hypothetical protein [Treponema sp.]
MVLYPHTTIHSLQNDGTPPYHRYASAAWIYPNKHELAGAHGGGIEYMAY